MLTAIELPLYALRHFAASLRGIANHHMRLAIEMKNVDHATVQGFGEEWQAYDQSEFPVDEAQSIFEDYFAIFDFTDLDEGFDLGCGSGRWAKFVAPRVKRLHCIDPSDAIEVARKNLSSHENVSFHRADAGHIPLEDGSQSFGYSLGVLHHIPDPEEAMRSAVAKLKPGAQFLVYLYYAMETKPAWFRGIWKVSDGVRRGISKLPFPLKKLSTSLIAAAVYWPLARFGRPSWPLVEIYQGKSFYTMRTDALDRFGTRLEYRFTREQIAAMMSRCGLARVRFSDAKPYWVAVGIKA